MVEKDIHEHNGCRKYPEVISFESEKVLTGNNATTLETECEIPDGTSIECTVKQEFPDVAEDDSNSQTIAVEDGRHTYDVTEIEYGGAHIWIEFELRSQSGTRFPCVRSYSLRRG